MSNTIDTMLLEERRYEPDPEFARQANAQPGIYERDPRHWKVEGADWDFGMDLLPPDVDRILPELSIGFERFPALQNVGIRRWVNGAFTSIQAAE